jgi:hypothetical protein
MAPGSPAEEDLAARLAELEKKLVTKERAEEIAAAAALDVLKLYENEVKKATRAAEEMNRAIEKREFARRVAASFEDRACRKSLDELLVEVVQDEVERALAEKLEDAVSARLKDPELAKKLQAPAGDGESDEFKQLSQRLAARLDKIEQEALPQIVKGQLDDRLGQKAGETPGVPDDAALQQKGGEVSPDVVRGIANTPEFKAMLEEKFKVMMTYLAGDVIPKQIKRLMGK